MNQNTTRFSDRVEDYIKYRPSYPDTITTVLKDAINFQPGHVVADIGSGTGISAIPFLKNGNRVFGVEPNANMRAAAAQLLASYTGFSPVEGTAENTNLADKCADLIFCGQAFHWFDKNESKREFARVLNNNGHIALVWNMRNLERDFQKEYENALLECIDEYKFVSHRNLDETEIAAFFMPGEMHVCSLANSQALDLEGLKGRLLSSSYCPKSGPAYTRLMNEMERIFSRYEKNGLVEFEYETKIYWR